MIPGDPGVVSAYIPITTGETNVPIYCPWDNVKLVYAYTTLLSNNAAGVLDGGDCTLTLKKSAEATTLGTITIANASAVGTVDDVDLTHIAAARGFNSTDYVTVNVDGHASTTIGLFNIALFFEPDK